MQSLRILSVVGARPNFMKIAPFIRQLGKYPDRLDHFLVHTGQHYDETMSESFFDTLEIPKPDICLGIGSGTHAEQVGQTMIAFEKVVRERKPDWIVVVGDVNATCACSITAAKEHVKLAHIEAGLRSFDLSMPEEINRMVADRLSDLLFTSDTIADGNLRNEGVPDHKIKCVGNIMIDTLEKNRCAASELDLREIVGANLVDVSSRPRVMDSGRRSSLLSEGGYAVLTLHRPSNVDNRDILAALVAYFVDELSRAIPLVWTVHPRTRKQLELFGLWGRAVSCPDILLLEPLGYREMLRLNLGARVMLTDSGGLQEECCVLGTPCITLRECTERPVTLREKGGVAELAGNSVVKIRSVLHEMTELPGHPVKSQTRRVPREMSKLEFRPPLWDGRTAERIAQVFADIAGN